jgi:two-component system KDP operon response regulator KdpE
VSRVLVVDDEPQIVRALVVNLRARGYGVLVARDGRSALQTAAQHPPDLVLLDLGLPDIEGTEVINGLRGWTTAPIIVLTGRTDQVQKIAALDSGADDYITKPFGIEELFARMRAVSRRVSPQDQPSVRLGEWVVDLAAHRVRRAAGGDDLRLTPTEWRVLEMLVRNPGRLVTKQQLLHEVWGPGYDTESNYLRLYLAQLRRKLEPDPARPAYLLTETGMGYRFRGPADDATGR